jgi:hypothetical protein
MNIPAVTMSNCRDKVRPEISAPNSTVTAFSSGTPSLPSTALATSTDSPVTTPCSLVNP